MNIWNAIRQRWRRARVVTLHARSLSAIERWQRREARKLVQHAESHVPAYAALYKARGVSAEMLERASDLARFPIVTKDFFLARPVEEYTDTSRAIRSKWKKTSGSTGRPLTLLLGYGSLIPD